MLCPAVSASDAGRRRVPSPPRPPASPLAGGLRGAMEGPPADDAAPPDSWEVADLDRSMSRLLVSASPSSSRRSPPPELVDKVAALSPPPPPPREPLGSSLSPAAAAGQVDQFLREALEKPRERLSILRMEQEIENFIRDPTQQQLELQPLPNSYLRLAAHRIAQHYCLQSTAVPDNNSLDGSGSRIVLQKTSVCCLPQIRLADIPVNLPQEESSNIVKVAIKQRPQKQTQNSMNMNTHSLKASHSKSMDERKEEYNRARARIFSGNNSSNDEGRSEGETTLPDVFQQSSVMSSRLDEIPFCGGSEVNLSQSSIDSSGGSSRSSRGRAEKDAVVNRYKASNRVAIFRDREMDRKDPDYDRNYDRYMQRFDPGFGFNGGGYSVQPLYTPAVNYNTEFPQLGSGHRHQISIEHQPRPIPQHLHGPWGTGSASTALGYCPPEGLMTPFSPNHVGAPSNPSIYLSTSQYPAQPIGSRPGMGFIHPHEHGQPFTQSHQQQSDASFGLARPR
ncbi:hypothetical protein Taro_018961 [Colocasia esculenta]|uniref:R3H domain-containing protein 2 n=1 Tax=Colocasia esculenta TaxID=4460 RepID=A0A843UXT2_COLES|nr:hypothetical protein [Colocasia esculenta]